MFLDVFLRVKNSSDCQFSQANTSTTLTDNPFSSQTYLLFRIKVEFDFEIKGLKNPYWLECKIKSVNLSSDQCTPVMISAPMEIWMTCSRLQRSVLQCWGVTRRSGDIHTPRFNRHRLLWCERLTWTLRTKQVKTRFSIHFGVEAPRTIQKSKGSPKCPYGWILDVCRWLTGSTAYSPVGNLYG